MGEIDASRTSETSWMGTLERQPLEGMELSKAFESSCLAGASGAAAADLAGDDEQETKCLLFSYHSGGAAGGNLRDTPARTENVQQISTFKIDGTKHKVFLSHSGEQKDFVEQLCVDLEARGYMFPFFDQRQHSLPKGKDFVPFIKEAAKRCHVAVIVLSEKFLCSKWPMIELAEFHSAQQAGNQQLNMLPLFYKLVVDDLDDRAIEDRWMPRWRKYAEGDRRIDVEKWGAAVRALRKANGIVFGKNGTSEVGYRKEVVRSIFRLSLPDLLYGSSREMVGYDRMCEIAGSRFMKDASAGPSVLGLYGTTGRGKTTLCKALCDHFSAEFLGRVCHVELGEGSRMKRQKMMLGNLHGIEKDVLERLTDVCQGLELLRVHVHREPVFLAIDNVTGDESSLREAREYLEVGFHPKSRILITSRSVVNVQDLLPGSQFCMAMPRLRVEEAGEIFLRSAAPMKSISGLTNEERRFVALCINQCIFDSEGVVVWCEPDVDVMRQLLSETGVWESNSYHPLALSALGDFFRRYSGNTHMLRWKDHLGTSGEPFKDVWSCPNGIGRIIGLQFSSLHPSEQLLFLDIALYSREFIISMSDIDDFGSRWLDWVSELHDVSAAVMERKLQDLTRSGMIKYDNAYNDIPICTANEGYGVFNVPVPTLYREFAEWYATEHGMKGLKKNSWGVCQSSGAAQNRHPSLSDLIRLRVFDLSRASARLVASKMMQELRNLEVLHLHSCPNLTELNLQGLDSLRHLELVKLKKLVTVTLSGNSGADEDLGIYESLQSVALHKLDSLTHGPDLRSCRSLHWLRVFNCPNWTNLEQISECRDLKDLMLLELVPQQWASIPIVESLPSLQHFSLVTVGFVDVEDVIDAVECLECWHQLEFCGALMVEELLRHLRSVIRVDDSSPDVVYNNGDGVTIEWTRRGCDKLWVTADCRDCRDLFREWG